MKTTTLTLTLMLLLNPTLHAIEVSKPFEKVSPSQAQPTELEALKAKIIYFNKYLTQLPIEIQETIGILTAKKADGQKAESMVIGLVY
jgi:hypothetical protein